MKAMQVLSHIFLSLVLYNAMAMGMNQAVDMQGGYIWMFMALGGAFLLGMQLMVIVAECKGEMK